MKTSYRALLIVALVFMAIGLVTRFNTGTPDLDQADRREETGPLGYSRPLLSNIVGKRRPDFFLSDLSGVEHSIDEWDGKVLAINFWASWCLPCLTEIPELISLQSEYGSSGFQVLGIALEKPDKLGEFINKHGMQYPILAGEAAVIVVAENYGNRLGALPYTAVVDRLGKVVYTKAGPVTRDELEAIIQGLL